MTSALPSNEREFEELMQLVDSELHSEGVALPARPIRAFLVISKRFGLGLRIPTTDREPRHGVYTGEDLAIRIFAWYKSMYGRKINVNFRLCRTLVELGREMWSMSFPMTVGTVRVIVDKSPVRGANVVVGVTQPPTLNVLDCIDDLPDGLRARLQPVELHLVLREFMEGQRQSVALRDSLDRGMMPEVLCDVEASVEFVVGRSVSFGQSRWASLQAAEKAIKTFIRLGGKQAPNTHDLGKLMAIAGPMGLGISSRDMSSAQCDARVRYGEVVSTASEAVLAHKAALRIVAAVCRLL